MPKGTKIVFAFLAVAILALSIVPAYASDNADAAEKVTLTPMVIPEGSGTVRGAGEYDVGKMIRVEAVPAEGYRFVEWADKSKDPSKNFYMDADKVATVYFEKIPMFSLVIKSTEGGEVGGAVPGEYVEGTPITLYAVAHDGYKFVKWRDGSTKEVRHEFMNSSKTFTAEFESTAPPSENVIGEWVVWVILGIFVAAVVLALIFVRGR
jgi:hypothetical protein